MAINFIEPNMDGSDLHVGIVTARFNEWACDAMLDACLKELKANGVKDENITVLTVPGALEIPAGLRMLNELQYVDSAVAIGCVIRGETYHFELVSNESARGISEFIGETEIPTANCVLTVENEEQAKVRVEEKGRDGARVAIEMGNLSIRANEAFAGLVEEIDDEDWDEDEDDSKKGAN